MERTQSKQTGFSIVELIIAIVVVGVIGAAGWFVYQHNRPKGANAAENTQTTNQQTPTTPSPTVAYLTITEWGVKLPLSDSIKGAYYIPGISSKGSDGLPNQMWIGLTSLNGNGCTATNNSGPALIFRALPTDTDPVSGKLLTEKYPNGAIIGSYYYGYEDFTTSSSNTCKAPQTTLQTVKTALSDAAKNTITAPAN